ncbi:hypothetical protein ACFIQG_20535 [Comamonas odontotermitis]|uniref:hypothetical protein n=1 Tax=Comamonas odontotermitis TaxID=379895 RepID=UPI003670E3F1
MSLFDDEPISHPKNDDGFLSWEERREIWADTEYIKYSDFMEKLYDDEKYYKLIEDIRDAEWWQKLRNGNIGYSIKVTEPMGRIIKNDWPDFKNDINFFYRDLRLLCNKSRNKIRDNLSNFYNDHLQMMELLIYLACLQMFLNFYSVFSQYDISNTEDLIKFEGVDFVHSNLGRGFSMKEHFPLAFNDVLIYLLNGAQNTYDQGGKAAEKIHNPSPPDDDMPSIRRI